MDPIRPRILLIGPLPPPDGGWAHVVSSMFNRSFLDKLDLIPYDTNLRKDAHQHTNIPLLLSATKQLVAFGAMLTKAQPEAAILFLGRGGGFWRDQLILRMCLKYRIPTVLRFLGGSVLSWLNEMPRYMRHTVIQNLGNSRAALLETWEMMEQWQGLCPSVSGYRVPNFVNIDQLPPRSTGEVLDRFQAVYLGTMTPTKGVELILSSVDPICDVYDCTFHFIGNEIEPGYLSYFRSLASTLRHSYAVNIYGYLPKQEAHKLLSSCQLFLFPSQWPGEGQPAALIEAMAMGLVPITSAWRGMKEIIRNSFNGQLLDTVDSEALTKQIIQVIEHPELRRLLSQNAKETILNHYSSKPALNQYLQILSDVL